MALVDWDRVMVWDTNPRGPMTRKWRNFKLNIFRHNCVDVLSLADRRHELNGTSVDLAALFLEQCYFSRSFAADMHQQ